MMNKIQKTKSKRILCLIVALVFLLFTPNIINTISGTFIEEIEEIEETEKLEETEELTEETIELETAQESIEEETEEETTEAETEAEIEEETEEETEEASEEETTETEEETTEAELVEESELETGEEFIQGTTEEETMEETPEEGKKEKTIIMPGSISGFIWNDGNGTPPYGWNGIYDDGYEYPLAGFTVYLFMTNNLSVPIAQTQTDWDGIYIFEDLEPGNYIVGIRPCTLDYGEYRIDYLTPMSKNNENVFTTNWMSFPMTAYSGPINIVTGETVENINGGMRLPMPFQTTANVPFSNLANANPNDDVLIDGIRWFVVKIKKNYQNQGVDYALLIRQQGDLVAFNSNNNNVYSSSALRPHYNNEYNRYASSTIKQIAVVPYLADIVTNQPGNRDIFSEPTAILAGASSGTSSGTWKDVFFPLSHADIYELNGNRVNPLADLFQTNFPLVTWSRTAVNTSGSGNVIGTRINAGNPRGYIDYGLSPQSMYVYANPAVWVIAGTVKYTIKVYYIDTNGVAIGTPTFKEYSVNAGTNFTLDINNTADVPNISGYTYANRWRYPTGTTHNGGTPTIPNVSKNDEIWLIYEQAPVNAAVTVSKEVENKFADKTKDFVFTAYFMNASNQLITTGSYSYTGGIIPGSGATPPVNGSLSPNYEGKAVFTLKHGQTITITVPANVQIRIVEDPYNSYNTTFTDSTGLPGGASDTGYRYAGVGLSGAVTQRTFAFKNAYIQTTATIKKIVTNGGDTNKKFEITVRLADSAGTSMAGTIIDYAYSGPNLPTPSSGQRTLNIYSETMFELTHNQSVTIYVPSDGRIQVYEAKYPDPVTDRYKTYIWDSYVDNPLNKPGPEKYDTGSTPMLNMTTTARTFEFTNERKVAPPTGIDLGSKAMMLFPIFGIFAGATSLTIKEVYRRRKKIKER